MGCDKALLAAQGKTLLERTLVNAHTVAPRTVIVGPRDKYSDFGETIEDIYPDCGPLGGIHAALSSTDSDLNLVLSVDMPLLDPAFLAWFVALAAGAPEIAVVPDALGGLQPLCAVYRRSLREAAEDALRRGDYKIGHLFSRVPTRFVSETEIQSGGFSPQIFRNVNTREDYESVFGTNSTAGAGVAG